MSMHCTNCAHPIPADLDGRQPPWCPRCGASIKPVAAVAVADLATSPPATSAPKPSQGAMLLQATRAATTKVDYYIPKRGWRAAYEATIRLACWKQHTCSACGCVYRYCFHRSAEGDGGLPELAQQNAEANLMKKVASGKWAVKRCSLIHTESQYRALVPAAPPVTRSKPRFLLRRLACPRPPATPLRR